MQLYLEYYTAEVDFSFNVDITHKETFPKTVLSIKSSHCSNLIEKSVSLYNRKQEIKTTFLDL
jgi:hypothetical protein